MINRLLKANKTSDNTLFPFYCLAIIFFFTLLCFRNPVSCSAKESTRLPYARITAETTVNPWNFTITLKSSRILLKKEVAKSKIVLSSKKKKNFKIIASFYKLSKNGRNILYKIPASKQHLLCPANTSKNGIYYLQSSLFAGKRKVRYSERLTKNTIAGFVCNYNGKPIANASVRLKTTSKTLTCKTNKNGYYHLSCNRKPVSLTATKKGFQKNTITSLNLSSKGIVCENIILKSSKNSSCLLDFLVTDYNNQPLSDTTIQIFSATARKNTQKLSGCSSQTDTLKKGNIVFSGKTDSSGRLSLGSAKNAILTPYTKIVWKNNTQFSYSRTYQSSLWNRKQLAKPLRQDETYLIYFTKNATQKNTAKSYETKKMIFSFAPFYTNHVLLHMQLKELPVTKTNSLYIDYNHNIDIDSCQTLTVSLFCKEDAVPFYQKTYAKKSLAIAENTISLPLLSSLSLPDGNYYVQLRANDSQNTVTGISSVSSLQVRNGRILPLHISLEKPYYSRVLVFGNSVNMSNNMAANSSATASFNLYQIWDSRYFLVGSFSSTPFLFSSYRLPTANLVISSLLKDGKYLLCPVSDAMIGETYSVLNTQKLILSQNAENTLSEAPSAQICCKPANSSSYTAASTNSASTNSASTNSASITSANSSSSAVLTAPSDFIPQTLDISYYSSNTITQNSVRTSTSYPNTILAFYNSNGKLLKTSLTVFSGTKTVFRKKKGILDIYQNKRILKTNQDSYR